VGSCSGEVQPDVAEAAALRVAASVALVVQDRVEVLKSSVGYWSA